MIKVIILTILLVFGIKQAQCTNQSYNNDVNAVNFNRVLFPSVKRIWVYWDKQIEKAPLLVQMCLQKMRMVSEEEHWELTLMSDDNLHQYISNYESEFLVVKSKMKHPQWKAGVADLIRLSVLQQHGGLWFDMSTILIHGLEWMNNLQNIPYLLTNSQLDHGQQPDILIPYLNYYQSLSEQRNIQGKLSKLLPGYEAWFIAATKPHLDLMKQWKQYYIKHITQDASLNRKQQIQQQYYAKFLKGEYLNIIQDKQREIDYSLGLLQQRKNANKELNIVGLHGEYGPFALYLKLIPQLDMAFTHTIQQLEQQYLLTINFFVKFTNQQRNYFQNKIYKLAQIYTQYHTFQKYIASKPSLQQCNDVVFIVEESIFGRLIKNNKIAQSNKVYLISQQQNLQWRRYCQQYKKKVQINSYPIVTNSSQIQSFWDWLYYFQLIDNQMRISIIKYFQNVSWMGIMSIDIKELYYWKKVYEERDNQQSLEVDQKQKNDESEKDVFQIVNIDSKNQSSKQQGGKNNNLKTQQNDSINNHVINGTIINKKNKKWSTFTIQQQLHIFLQIFMAKIQPVAIKFWYLTKDIHPYLNQLIPLVLYGFLLFNLIIIPLRFRLKYLKYAVKIFCHLALSKQLDKDTQRVWIQIKKSLRCNILKKIFILCLKVLLFGLKLILCFVIGIIFVCFQIVVILKFIRVCLDGDIYNQQVPLMTIMIIQIIFRQIIYKCLSVNSWVIPGISLQFLYRMFLPIYHVSLGRCLVAFGQKRQQWNFGLMFTVCLMYPVVVGEIEHQARKVLEVKKGFVDNSKVRSKVMMRILSLLANATSAIQRVVLGFLVLSYLMPNILYMYYGNEHFIRLIVVKLTKAGPLLLGILLAFYINELFHFGKQIYYQCKDIVLVKTIVSKTNAISENKQVNKIDSAEKSYMKMKEESTIIQMQFPHQYSARQNHSIDNPLQLQQQPQEHQSQIQTQQQLEQQLQHHQHQQHQQQQPQVQFETHCKWKPRLFKYSVITLVHLAKYSINTYLIMNLCIDPYPQRVYKNVLQIWKPKVMQVLFLLIINCEVEKVIDQLCLKMQHIYNKYLTKNNNMKRQKQDYFHNHNWCVAIIGLFIFQLLRLQMFQYIFEYFNVIDKGRFDLRWQVEKLFPLYKQDIIYYTFAGYWLMRIIQCFFTENGNRIKNCFVKTVQPQELTKINFSNMNDYNKSDRTYLKEDTQDLQELSSYELNKLQKNDI